MALTGDGLASSLMGTGLPRDVRHHHLEPKVSPIVPLGEISQGEYLGVPDIMGLGDQFKALESAPLWPGAQGPGPDLWAAVCLQSTLFFPTPQHFHGL